MSDRSVKAQQSGTDLGDAVTRAREAGKQQEQKQDQEKQKVLEELVKNCNAIAKDLTPHVSKMIIGASNNGKLSLSFGEGELAKMISEAGSRLGIKAPLHPDFQHAVMSVILKELNQSLEARGIRITAQKHEVYEGVFPPIVKLAGFELNWADPSARNTADLGVTIGKRYSSPVSEKDTLDMLKPLVEIMLRENLPELQLPTRLVR